jgi:DNA repair protein RadA/Sms
VKGRVMMAKTKTVYFCAECGADTPKWQGKCPACGAWNTLQEHIERPAAPVRAGIVSSPYRSKAKTICQVDSSDEIRFSTAMGELDRVLGGGAVAGSLVLVGGAPGIGKSTLLLQICRSLAAERTVLYVSGEES